MTPEERSRLLLSSQEDLHGTIKAPAHPWLASFTDAYRGLGRRLEGSPMGLLYDEGLGDYMGKLAYGETPNWWERLSAAGAIADVTPFGLLAMVPPAAARRAGMGVGKTKRRVGTTGKYVGAPSNVDSPQALAKMRKDYMDLVDTGVLGRDWYQESSEWVDQVAPDNMRQAVADALGITSQGTGVDPNLGFTIKAMNQRAAGMPVETGRFPASQSPLIESSFAGDRSRLGPKREPFADNLSVGWAPERAEYPVHDIWQGRAFGYTHPNGKPWDAGFSAQQHAFMDEETGLLIDRANAARLGGHDDWDPLKMQAASWTGAKIRAGEVDPADAAKHYGDFSSKYQAFGTHEQTPGAGIGHLEGLLSAPYDTRAEFTRAGSWADPAGRDTIYSSAGMLTEPTSRSVGAYTPAGTGVLEINPAEVARPLVSFEGGALRPHEAGMLDIGESARAYLDAQNAGAWHTLVPDSQTKVGERTSVTLDLANPSQEQMGRLSDLATRSGMFAVDAGDSVRLINDEWSDIGGARTGATLGKELKGDFGSELRDITDGATATRRKIQSGYQDCTGSGQATEKFLGDMEKLPEFASNIEPALRRKAAINLERDQAASQATGFAVREDIQNARRVLVQEGIEGLRKALKSGAILPAAVAAVLAPSLLSDEPQPGGLLMGS